MCLKALVAFSVYTNGSKLLSTSQPAGSITCIHGIRFLSMTWVVLGHGFLYPQQVSGESVSHMCLALPPAARGDLASSSVSHPLVDMASSSVSHPLVHMASSSVTACWVCHSLVDMASSSVTACWVGHPLVGMASSSVSHPLMDTAFSSVSHPLVDMASSSVSYPLVDMASSSVTACWVSDICGRSLLFN